MKRLLKVLETISEHLATGCFVAFFLVVLLQISYRYLLNLPLTWSEEAARALNIWAVFLGVAVAVRRGQHLRVDLLDSYLARRLPRVQLALHVLTTGLSLLLVGVLLRGAYATTVDRWSVRLTILPLPQGVVSLALLLSAGLMTLFFAVQLLQALQACWRGTSEPHQDAS